MSRVIAFVDRSPLATTVVESARALAGLVGAHLEVVHAIDETDDDRSVEPVTSVAGEPVVRHDAPGPAAAQIIDELDADDVVVGVLGARSVPSRPDELGHVAAAVVTATYRTVVVIPPGGRALPERRLRMLLPLDDDPDRSAETLHGVLGFAGRCGEIVPLHVFDSDSVPMFVTSAEDRRVVSDEFRARHLPEIDADVELRLGSVAERVVAAIDDTQVDAVVICWHQHVEAGRAEIVRRLLRESDVPLVLEPISPRVRR